MVVVMTFSLVDLAELKLVDLTGPTMVDLSER